MFPRRGGKRVRISLKKVFKPNGWLRTCLRLAQPKPALRLALQFVAFKFNYPARLARSAVHGAQVYDLKYVRRGL